MSVISEFREFFTREKQVNVGDKADQELGFPVKEAANTCDGYKNVYNRLLPTHIASEKVINKFLASIGFKLNPEDTASNTEQGFIRVTDDNKIPYNSKDSNGYTIGIKAHQLPELITNEDIVATVAYKAIATGVITDTPPATDYRIVYKLRTKDRIVGSTYIETTITGSTNVTYLTVPLDLFKSINDNDEVIVNTLFHINKITASKILEVVVLSTDGGSNHDLARFTYNPSSDVTAVKAEFEAKIVKVSTGFKAFYKLNIYDSTGCITTQYAQNAAYFNADDTIKLQFILNNTGDSIVAYYAELKYLG